MSVVDRLKCQTQALIYYITLHSLHIKCLKKVSLHLHVRHVNMKQEICEQEAQGSKLRRKKKVNRAEQVQCKRSEENILSTLIPHHVTHYNMSVSPWFLVKFVVINRSYWGDVPLGNIGTQQFCSPVPWCFSFWECWLIPVARVSVGGCAARESRASTERHHSPS